MFSMFLDALTSRTNPSSLEPAKRSSLSTALYSLSLTDPKTRTIPSLLEALTSFTQEIELSSVAEINHDCLAFIKDCISNVTTFKGLYGSLLKLATYYGEKLDDSVIADKRKMRKDFGVQSSKSGLILGTICSSTQSSYYPKYTSTSFVPRWKTFDFVSK